MIVERIEALPKDERSGAYSPRRNPRVVVFGVRVAARCRNAAHCAHRTRLCFMNPPLPDPATDAPSDEQRPARRRAVHPGRVCSPEALRTWPACLVTSLICL